MGTKSSVNGFIFGSEQDFLYKIFINTFFIVFKGFRSEQIRPFYSAMFNKHIKHNETCTVIQ